MPPSYTSYLQHLSQQTQHLNDFVNNESTVTNSNRLEKFSNLYLRFYVCVNDFSNYFKI